MKQINNDDLNPIFEYESNDERQQHLNDLLYYPGWSCTSLHGGLNGEPITAAYQYK